MFSCFIKACLLHFIKISRKLGRIDPVDNYIAAGVIFQKGHSVQMLLDTHVPTF